MPTPTKQARAEAASLVAIGELTRLTIIRTLAAGARTVSELSALCDMHQANVSHHVGILKRAGLVAVARDGRFARCALAGGRVNAGGIELVHPLGLKVLLPRG